MAFASKGDDVLRAPATMAFLRSLDPRATQGTPAEADDVIEGDVIEGDENDQTRTCQGSERSAIDFKLRSADDGILRSLQNDPGVRDGRGLIDGRGGYGSSGKSTLQRLQQVVNSARLERAKFTSAKFTSASHPSCSDGVVVEILKKEYESGFTKCLCRMPDGEVAAVLFNAKGSSHVDLSERGRVTIYPPLHDLEVIPRAGDSEGVATRVILCTFVTSANSPSKS